MNPPRPSGCSLSGAEAKSNQRLKGFQMVVVYVSLSLLLIAKSAHAQFLTNNLRSDATWRAVNPAPAVGWNTDIVFDDSDAAGWQFAFKSPSRDNIWFGSNLSADA